MNDTELTWTSLGSPIGRLVLIRGPKGLRAIRFEGEGHPDPTPTEARRVEEDPAADQLRAYFAGTLRDFDLRLDPQGTPFQREVWRALQDIPWGQTCAYADLARAIGRPSATRAVGAANGKNPLPIVIPCHRVIGRDGSLTGYGGGLPIKRALLKLEGWREDGGAARGEVQLGLLG